MREADNNGSAIALAGLLHLGILAFLVLATLPCASWETFFENAGLPASMNPVQCSKPMSMPGPVIEATLIGPAGAPPPKPAKVRREQPAPLPPPKAAKPEVPTPEKPKLQVPTLPPPPERPDIKNQQKVVEMAREKAEQQKKAQQERERQHQAELEAQQAKTDKLLKQLDEIRKQREAAERKSKLEQQKLAQLNDLKQSTTQAAPSEAPPAPTPQSGTAGPDQGLMGQYVAAIQSAVTQNWLRPDNIQPGQVCPIHIVQIPGGEVIKAEVMPSCPFDDIARRSVEAAVLRAQPLPYQGFENVFQRDLTLNFKVEN